MTEEMCKDFERDLLSPYYYIVKVQGKGLRTKVLSSFNYWLQVPNNTVKHIFDILNISYTASILYDDIQDSSIVRRGLPAAHCVYGVPLTLTTCVHLHFITLKKLMDFNMEAAKIYTEEMCNTARGQGQDVYWRENFICPTEEEYKDMINHNFGCMLKLTIRIIQLFSKDKRDYTNLILLFGLYFQIKDDYCNLGHPEALEEWPADGDKHSQELSFCEDITEGKFTLPIIHALGTAESEKIKKILRQRTRDVDLKKYFLSLLEKAGSLQYTRDTLWALDKEIREELSRLGGNPEMEAVLDELLIWQTKKKTNTS